MPVAEIVRRVCGGEEPDPTSTDELILDNSKVRRFTPEDATYLASFVALETLCLNSTRLASLENFPPLPELKTLELADNKLSQAEDMKLLACQCPKLTCLSLAHNQISIIDVLKPLAALKHLEEIDIEENPFVADESTTATVRERLFETLPQLRLVDSVDREGREVESEDDPGDEGVEGGTAGDEGGKNLLFKFYHQDFKEGESDEDDFNPESEEDEEDVSDEEEEEEDEEESKSPEKPAIIETAGASSKKRALEEPLADGSKMRRRFEAAPREDA